MFIDGDKIVYGADSLKDKTHRVAAGGYIQLGAPGFVRVSIGVLAFSVRASNLASAVRALRLTYRDNGKLWSGIDISICTSDRYDDVVGDVENPDGWSAPVDRAAVVQELEQIESARLVSHYQSQIVSDIYALYQIIVNGTRMVVKMGGRKSGYNAPVEQIPGEGDGDIIISSGCDSWVIHANTANMDEIKFLGDVLARCHPAGNTFLNVHDAVFAALYRFFTGTDDLTDYLDANNKPDAHFRACIGPIIKRINEKNYNMTDLGANNLGLTVIAPKQTTSANNRCDDCIPTHAPVARTPPPQPAPSTQPPVPPPAPVPPLAPQPSPQLAHQNVNVTQSVQGAVHVQQANGNVVRSVGANIGTTAPLVINRQQNNAALAMNQSNAAQNVTATNNNNNNNNNVFNPAQQRAATARMPVAQLTDLYGRRVRTTAAHTAREAVAPIHATDLKPADNLSEAGTDNTDHNSDVEGNRASGIRDLYGGYNKLAM